MISIQNVSKWFGKFKAVDNINIEVEKGEIFGLLGLNGAGKTTTQRMVSTVFQPSEGNITVNGFNSKNQFIARWLWYTKKELPKKFFGLEDEIIKLIN